MRYYPFGETRLITGSVPTDRRYTGQRREDPALGSLYDFNARFYSPALGRFLSADTIVPQLENPQAWNRYAYVVDNPLKYNDPTGHCFFLCALVGAAIGGIAGAVSYTANVITNRTGWDSNAYWASVGEGAGAGAMIGGTIGTVAPAALEAASTTLAGASAATGSTTLASAATTTYAAAGTMASADFVALKMVSDKFSMLRQINLAPSSPAPSMSGTSSSAAAGVSTSGPDFVVTQSGEAIPVPDGAVGPSPIQTGKGFMYTNGSGGKGLGPRVAGVRIMDPTLPKGASPGYPNGYVSYFNSAGQTVNPSTGQTIPKSDPWWHIPLR